MDLKKIKQLVKMGAKGSGEKQLKLFMKNKKITSIFKEIINGSNLK